MSPWFSKEIIGHSDHDVTPSRTELIVSRDTKDQEDKDTCDGKCYELGYVQDNLKKIDENMI